MFKRLKTTSNTIIVLKSQSYALIHCHINIPCQIDIKLLYTYNINVKIEKQTIEKSRSRVSQGVDVQDKLKHVTFS